MSKAIGHDRHTLRGKIPPRSYADFMDHEFGEQVLEGLELLSMSELYPLDEDGYYYCFSKSAFTNKVTDELA